MTLTAPRLTLILAAACMIGFGVLIQMALGHRLGVNAGQTTEVLAMASYAGAIILLLAPLGRARALMAGGLAIILMAWAVHLNARLSANLENQFGGNVIAAHRILINTIIIGPCLGIVVGIATAVIARSGRIQWTPKMPVA
jgi:hypothetical protein